MIIQWFNLKYATKTLLVQTQLFGYFLFLLLCLFFHQKWFSLKIPWCDICSSWIICTSWPHQVSDFKTTFFCLVGIYGILSLSIESKFWELYENIFENLSPKLIYTFDLVSAHSWAKGIDLGQLSNSAFTYNLSLSDVNNTCMCLDCARGKKTFTLRQSLYSIVKIVFKRGTYSGNCNRTNVHDSNA